MSEPLPAYQTKGPGRRPIPVNEWPYCQRNGKAVDSNEALRAENKHYRNALQSIITILDREHTRVYGLNIEALRDFICEVLGDEPTIEPKPYTEETGI